jgi:lysophospholipase L1-like esterase
MQLERGFRITPTDADAGNYTMTITATDSTGTVTTATTTLVIAASTAGSGITDTLIVLGDSTTNNGIAVTKLAQNFSDDAMGLTLYGTRGTAPYKHEGRSGWTFNYYFTVAEQEGTDVVNPFFNPTTETFDASYYFANSGVSVPDWFFINLGINDIFGYTSDSALETAITTVKGLCDDMIASLKTAAPSMKIGLCLTIPPNHSQDAFGKAYSNGQTRHRYKRNNIIWVNRLIAEYDNRESEGIYLIPIHTNLDTVYNMGMETLPVNARNTTVTYQSPISNGGVHPVESGYWQIADVYTAFLKAHAED